MPRDSKPPRESTPPRGANPARESNCCGMVRAAEPGRVIPGCAAPLDSTPAGRSVREKPRSTAAAPLCDRERSNDGCVPTPLLRSIAAPLRPGIPAIDEDEDDVGGADGRSVCERTIWSPRLM